MQCSSELFLKSKMNICQCFESLHNWDVRLGQNDTNTQTILIVESFTLQVIKVRLF